jgi:hypothetical protein
LDFYSFGSDENCINRAFQDALVNCLSKTKTLSHIQLIRFPFEYSLEKILEAISTNPSIKILSVEHINGHGHHSLHTWVPRFLHVEQLHIGISLWWFARKKFVEKFMYLTLPRNFSIRLCSINGLKFDGAEFECNHKAYIRTILNRNCGIQQYVRQYANSTVKLLLERVNLINHGSYDLDHNRVAIPRMSVSGTCDDSNTYDIDMKMIINSKTTWNSVDTIMIPLELLPTIISNHFQSVSLPTFCYHGTTFLYHTISNLSSNIGSR